MTDCKGAVHSPYSSRLIAPLYFPHDLYIPHDLYFPHGLYFRWTTASLRGGVT
ncbi:hypothetical protein [Streptomyces sp. SudanB66_2053]|uniref:hypothetical protein n=1 Tax=Streptomyces TaxID=1883 RepID=UPI003F55B27E